MASNKKSKKTKPKRSSNEETKPEPKTPMGFMVMWVAVPCLLAIAALSVPSFKGMIFGQNTPRSQQQSSPSAKAAVAGDRKLEEKNRITVGPNEATCRSRFDAQFRSIGIDVATFSKELTIHIHRNGDPDPCGTADVDVIDALWEAYWTLSQRIGCPTVMDKFQTDAMVTLMVHRAVLTCSSVETDGVVQNGFLGYCDMGPDKTTVLFDHDYLVPNVDPNDDNVKFLPCHFHRREGKRMSNFQEIMRTFQQEPNLLPAAHFYAVPAGRPFMYAPKFVGEIFNLNHVEGSEGKNIYLKVLSLEPRLFDVFNFFSRDESSDLVQQAIAETKESHRIKRSSTGASGYNLNSKRTSESGYDTDGVTSMKVKRRCFSALGYDSYIASHADGLQILRYNKTKAYNSHLDYMEDKDFQLDHDFDSSGKGSNRFATILLYMTDLGENDGGETVFTNADSIDVDAPLNRAEALAQLRSSEKGAVLRRGSWEEDLTVTCRTKLSIRPHSSRAVLFYSQHPNGQLDDSSLHGACPILAGDKYAANLWVWNGPRQGYPDAPQRDKSKNNKNTAATKVTATSKLIASFTNTKKDPLMKFAKLYYGDKFWADLGFEETNRRLNTFEGHVWNIKVGGKTVKTWKISHKDGAVQNFEI